MAADALQIQESTSNEDSFSDRVWFSADDCSDFIKTYQLKHCESLRMSTSLRLGELYHHG